MSSTTSARVAQFHCGQGSAAQKIGSLFPGCDGHLWSGIANLLHCGFGAVQVQPDTVARSGNCQHWQIPGSWPRIWFAVRCFDWSDRVGGSLYPWLGSLAFRAFGIFSHGAAFALLAFNSVCSALTSWTIYRIARRVFGETVAVWSGWIWAIFPYAIYWPVIWVWDTSLSAFLLSLAFMVTLEMQDDNRLWTWFRYGLLWGVIALTNTSMVCFLPFSGCWLAYQLHLAGKRFLVPVVLSAVVFWAAITPWLVRDYVVFDKFIFIRGDFGSELWTGNNPAAQGTVVFGVRAGSNGALTAQYQKVGEAAWDAQRSMLAKHWIAENPGRFLLLTCRRIFLFWSLTPERLPLRSADPLFACLMLLPFAGLYLARRRRVHGAFLFLALVTFYPLIYYITFASPRYRHPIEPELLILAVRDLVGQPRETYQRCSRTSRTHKQHPTDLVDQKGLFISLDQPHALLRHAGSVLLSVTKSSACNRLPESCCSWNCTMQDQTGRG